MRSILWADDHGDENVHWTQRDHMPMLAVSVWIGGLVATVFGLFAAGLIGR